MREKTNLTSEIASRRPLESAGGNSGNPIERVTLRDGRDLVLKRVRPEQDWLARLAHDQGRLEYMWHNGIFERMPPVIDHTIVAVEPADAGWNVFMRNVSGVLMTQDVTLDRSGESRILVAMHELHDVFRGERLPELCSLVDRYAMFGPRAAQKERELGNPHGEGISQGWDAFPELVSGPVGDAVLTIVDRPSLLAEQLERHEQTLIHGDLRLGNLGFSDGRVVLIDWGERVGTAPPSVELAWFIGFDAYRFDTSPDDVIAQFQAYLAERFDGVALQLGLIGGLVQLGGIIGWWTLNAPDDAQRARNLSELAWWDKTVTAALETWSPT